MLRIRLAREGGKNKPAYAIVAAPQRSTRSRASQYLGFYDPTHNPPKLTLDKEKYAAWIKKGAQPSEAVEKLLAGTYQYVKYTPKKAEGEAETTKEKEKTNQTQAKGVS
ncbi:MAG: 30S ribosomal protein S16 [bacterium]|nr:30S ribosomal protein S16 [bacterium]